MGYVNGGEFLVSEFLLPSECSLQSVDISWRMKIKLGWVFITHALSQNTRLWKLFLIFPHSVLCLTRGAERLYNDISGNIFLIIHLLWQDKLNISSFIQTNFKRKGACRFGREIQVFDHLNIRKRFIISFEVSMCALCR